MGKLKDDDLLREARKRFQAGIDADKDNRDRDDQDRRFFKGEQWSDDEKRDRKGRITMTVNRLPQFVKQVTGEMRQNKPAIKVLPVDDQTDPQLAEVYSAIIRHIESNSDAHRIYSKTAEQAVIGGIGWYRVITDYLDETSFEQEILVKPIRNPLSVVIDPDAQELCKQDMNWAFVTELVSKEKFEKEHPDVSTAGFDAPGNEYAQWRQGDFIRVAEYWYRKPRTRKLAMFSDGSTGYLDEVSIEELTALRMEQGLQPIEITAEREVTSFKVCWVRMTGTAVIDRGEWQGKWIPIVPVIGEEVEVGDEVFRHGLIHHSKDAQKSYNYSRSAMIEHIGSQPKAPFLVTANQIKNYKSMWENANQGNPSVLVYDPDPKAPSAPQRQMPPTTPTAWYQEAQVADGDMKATTGIYDSSLGAQGNETSGIAIAKREAQGDAATFVYIDNLSATIRHTGNILIDLIPYIYSGERIIRIMGEDGAIEAYAKINARLPDGRTWNDITQGRYDVEVTTGPAYATRRQEAAESMMKFVQAVPPAGQVAADLIAKSMDWPNADKIADRMKMMLPPGIDPEVDQQRQQSQGEPQPSPEQQAMMADQQMQQARLESDAQAAQLKMQIQAQEGQAKLQLAQAEAQAEIELMRQKQDAELALARERFQFEMELALEKARLERDQAEHNARLKETGAAHAAHLAEQRVSTQRPGGALDK